MNAVQAFLVNAVRGRLAADGDSTLDERTDREIARYVFSNYRDTPLYGHGLRLSPSGLDLLERCFEAYRVPIADDLSMAHFVMLDRICALPYYVARGTMVLFDAAQAAELKMNGGNLSLFIDSRLLAKSFVE